MNASTDPTPEHRRKSQERDERWLEEVRGRFENVLRARLTQGIPVDPRLEEAMGYALLGGGKRLRPLLVYTTGHAFGIPVSMLDPPACAVECIHAYSLVHDDLPAMDDDDMRRGRPSCHKAFGEAMAILVGDALQSLAFISIAEGPDLPDAVGMEMMRILSRAAGPRGLVGGQSLDLGLQHLTVDEIDIPLLTRINHCKTGALIQAAIELGAVLATPDVATRAVLTEIGRDLGLAFQIWDDVLDARAETNASAGTRDAIPTLVDLLGLERSESEVRRLESRVLESVVGIGGEVGPLQALVQAMLRHRS